MTPQDCPLCRRLADLDAVPDGDLVARLRHGVAFLGPWQFYRGYCLLIVRRHAHELSALDDAERRGFLDEMCLLARAIEQAFRPHKLNYELLGNQVPHLHWHLFPRYRDDPDTLRPVWLALDRAERDADLRRRLQGDAAERPALIAALRQSLSNLGVSLA